MIRCISGIRCSAIHCTSPFGWHSQITFTEQRLPSVQSPSEQSPATILFVEDEPLIRRAGEDALLSMGHLPIMASCAAEALTALAHHADIRVMITDNIMPGMHGTQLAQVARRQYPCLKIILATGQLLSKQDSLDFPALMKPYLYEEMAAAISSALSRVDAVGT